MKVESFEKRQNSQGGIAGFLIFPAILDQERSFYCRFLMFLWFAMLNILCSHVIFRMQR